MAPRRSTAAALAALACSMVFNTGLAQEQITVDVLVYSANPAGIGAAIAAANGVTSTHSVLVMERLNMIGGMGAAGGVGLMNQGAGLAGVTGLGYVWGMLNGAYYNSTHPTLNVFPGPTVGAASFTSMLAAVPTITTRLGCRLTGASKDGADSACVTSATFLCNNDTQSVAVSAQIFIDASYDGDVMVAAGGIEYASGREGSSEYNESLAGVQLQDEQNESFDKQNLTVLATWPNGTLLKGISSDPLPPVGTADDRLMAFSYFPCVTTDPSNSVPYPMPEGYDADDFQLLQRQIEGVMANGLYPQGPDLAYFSEYHAYTVPGMEKLLLCCGVGPVNCDEPDLNRGWASASYEARLAMEQQHRYYLLGSLYYMANDLRVPNYTRYAIGRWGFCKDEYASNGYWPPQIYVRISNRMRGMTLLTQNNLANPRSKPDGVSMGAWEFDQHTMSRRAVPNPRAPSQLIALNEGYMRHEIAAPWRSCNHPDARCSNGSDNWYDVPFGVIVPQRGQASNLLVPVAISSTSIAYSSTRIEGMYMDLGTAAGVAAALALEAGPAPTGTAACPLAPFQDTNVTAVQQVLVDTYKQRIHGPINTTLDGRELLEAAASTA